MMNQLDPYQQVLLEPRTIEETGLSRHVLVDLTLKTIYDSGEISGQGVAQALRLPFTGVVETILEFLKREELVRILGSRGKFGERAFRYALSAKGSSRAQEALNRSEYVGPAPVTLEEYNLIVCRESSANIVVRPVDVQKALQDYVFAPSVYDKIGPAVNSGRSIFLYGPPGNGKTSIATSIVRMLGGSIHVPYAVAIGDQMIRVFDATTHFPVPQTRNAATANELGQPRRDDRWITVRRPAVVVGGELTLENLDLIYDPASKTYEAPFQMKANGGLFLIDDFGRQQVMPRDLLNRWIMPLDARVDYLTLHTGVKIEVPFEELIVFSTNLNPTELVDQAFLRRIRHKIRVDDPSEREFHEIFRRACRSKDIVYDQKGFLYFFQEHLKKRNRALKAVYPRDILDQIIDIATYRGIRPTLTKKLIDQAADAYFVDL